MNWIPLHIAGTKEITLVNLEHVRAIESGFCWNAIKNAYLEGSLLTFARDHALQVSETRFEILKLAEEPANSLAAPEGKPGPE